MSGCDARLWPNRGWKAERRCNKKCFSPWKDVRQCEGRKLARGPAGRCHGPIIPLGEPWNQPKVLRVNCRKCYISPEILPGCCVSLEAKLAPTAGRIGPTGYCGKEVFSWIIFPMKIFLCLHPVCFLTISVFLWWLSTGSYIEGSEESQSHMRERFAKRKHRKVDFFLETSILKFNFYYSGDTAKLARKISRMCSIRNLLRKRSIMLISSSSSSLQQFMWKPDMVNSFKGNLSTLVLLGSRGKFEWLCLFAKFNSKYPLKNV